MSEVLQNRQISNICTFFGDQVQELSLTIGEDQIDTLVDQTQYESWKKKQIKEYFKQSEKIFTEKEVKIILSNIHLANLLEDKQINKYDSNDLQILTILFPEASNRNTRCEIIKKLNQLENYKNMLNIIKQEFGSILKENAKNKLIIQRIHETILKALYNPGNIIYDE